MTELEVIKKLATQILNSDGMEIVDPIVLEEISFVPIIKHEIPKEDRDYLTLSEALEVGVCEIIDKGTEVSHILFKNNGEFPILIEEGDIFLGQGTQDRISVGTVMVEVKAVEEISVKCVHAPHYLSPNANFSYGGKASRGMLYEMRSLKFNSAIKGYGASGINQSKIWKKVNEEMSSEKSVEDQTKYTSGISSRRKKVMKRSKQLNFPRNTIGVVVVDSLGKIKGVEIHRSPNNFNVRKNTILESVETNVNWEATGKGPFSNAKEKAKKLFQKISKLKKGKDTLKQTELEGLIINSEGLQGEAFTSAFYSTMCPSCYKSKPRTQECPSCGFLEEAPDDFTYMSLF
ncbi:MAG: ARPP-1 family domain-containing protein [Promethearchaeota archaeon]